MRYSLLYMDRVRISIHEKTAATRASGGSGSSYKTEHFDIY